MEQRRGLAVYPPSPRSLLRELLVAALTILFVAWAINRAVCLLLSVLWPLAGLAVMVLGGVLAWRLWQVRRGGW